MRFVSLAAALFSLGSFLPVASAESVSREDVELVRVWPGYRDAASFTRLGEYFGAAPDAANRAALRTEPARREGYYWFIRTRSAAAQSGCTLRLDVRRADREAVESHTFAVDLPAGTHPFHAGLTGSDWSDAEERPVAWRLQLTDRAGNVLAAEQSFLWDASS